MARVTNSFEDIKQRIIDANDLELHFVALIVFNELTTRRLGPDSLVLDSSGCAVTVTKKMPRAKTPRKPKVVTNQDEVDAMFKLNIGEDVDLEAGMVIEMPDEMGGASQSPEPVSDPRPIPTKKGATAKTGK